MTQPRNFIMSSDYPIPILALKLSTTINVPVGQYWNENSAAQSSIYPSHYWTMVY